MRTVIWLPLFCALWSARADAQSPNGHVPPPVSDASEADPSTAAIPPPPEFESRPRSDFENALMGELACTCGTCALEPINTCTCESAAKMRAEVLAELDAHDLSTEAGRRAAAEAVRASFAAKHGPKALRHRPNADAPVAIAVALGIVVVIGVRTVRRRGGRGGEKKRDDLDA